MCKLHVDNERRCFFVLLVQFEELRFAGPLFLVRPVVRLLGHGQLVQKPGPSSRATRFPLGVAGTG